MSYEIDDGEWASGMASRLHRKLKKDKTLGGLWMDLSALRQGTPGPCCG